MNRRIILFCLILLTGPLHAQWLNFTDASAEWLAGVGPDDEEKDLATGDLNKDGLMDIVVVRKAPFSNQGPRADLLLLNNGTSLEDQTATYAPQFLTRLTDARDVVIADFDGDTWLDVVIASTFEDQPVYYRNLGEGGGNWFGLVDESASRLPLPLNVDPLQFCALWAGDVSGDGNPDIYFSNYDPNGNSEDVLLINDGNGVFTDESDARLGDLRNSAFGTSVEIHDVDNDGDNDIIKISTLFAVAPYNEIGVFVLYNNGDGTFSNWENIAQGEEPYMFTADHIDGDLYKDIYIVDDQQDFYHLVSGAVPNSSLIYTTENSTDPRTEAFGGNCKFADLDGDGWADFGIADVDVDIPPCNSGASMRKFSLMKNDQGILDPVYGSTDQPWNVSTYDFVFLDANDDNLMDFLLGDCSGYTLFLQEGDSCDIMLNLPEEITTCQDQIAFLDAGAGFTSYLWNTGATTQVITPATPGLYCVTVTDANGCTGNDCVQLNILPIPIISINGPSDVCPGAMHILEVESNIPIAEFLWSTGDINNPTAIFSPGIYCVTVTSEDGCTNATCVEIEETPELDPVIMGNPVICGGTPASLSVLSSYVSASWTTGQFGLSIIVDVPGQYGVTVTDIAGCTGDTSVNVITADSPETQITGPTTFCAGDTILLCADSGFEEYRWTTGELTECIVIKEVDTTEVICVTVTDMNGCTDQACVEVTQIDLTPPLITVPEIFCDGDTAVLSVDSSYAQLIWSNGSNNSSITTTMPGKYSITVSDANGCTAVSDTMLYKYFDLGPDAVICEGDTFFVEQSIGDTTFTFSYHENGTYTETITDSLGNDCSDVINVQVLSIDTTFKVYNFCEDENFDTDTLGGVFTGSAGCDSIVIPEIVIHRDTTFTVMQQVCFGDTLPETTTDSLISSFGCDSVVVTEFLPGSPILIGDLIVTPDRSIGEGAVTLVGGEGLSFLWSTGDSTEMITGLSRGIYTVTVTDANGCTGTFEAFVPLVIPNPDFDPDDLPEIYPNPSNGSFNFHQDHDSPSIISELHIMDIFGRVIKVVKIHTTGTTSFFVDAVPGVYFAYAFTEQNVVGVSKIVISD